MKMKTARGGICCQGPLSRPCYFPGLLVTPEIMILEQDYFRNRLRLHNRMLHGWGVVCGAQVCRLPVGANEFAPWRVIVKPGYILGPCGDEILLDCPREVDLRGSGVSGVCGGVPARGEDPWCSTGMIERDRESPVFIGVRYKEIKAQPVPVQPLGCGCDETQCEYSRCQDGYEIGILPQCPESHRTPQPPVDPDGWTIPECPPCPECGWVVLAEVELGPAGEIVRIDNCSCRRLVVGSGNVWLKCQEVRFESVETEPQIIVPGTPEVKVRARGEFIQPPVEVRFLLHQDGKTTLDDEIKAVGEIDVAEVEVSGRKLQEVRFVAKVSEAASAGVRDFQVVSSDGRSGTFTGAFEVKAPKTEAPPKGATSKKKAASRSTRKSGSQS